LWLQALLYPVDVSLALSVINRFLQRGELDKIDFSFLLHNLVRALPHCQGAVESAKKLEKTETLPLIDIILSLNHGQDTTGGAFLLEVIPASRTPQIIMATLQNEMFSYHDRPYIAKLCEQAGLYTNGPDIKRLMTRAPTLNRTPDKALDEKTNSYWGVKLREASQDGETYEEVARMDVEELTSVLAVAEGVRYVRIQMNGYARYNDLKSAVVHKVNLEFFGRLDKPTTLECLNDVMATNMRQNLQLVVHQLGSEPLVKLFAEFKSYDGLFYTSQICLRRGDLTGWGWWGSIDCKVDEVRPAQPTRVADVISLQASASGNIVCGSTKCDDDISLEAGASDKIDREDAACGDPQRGCWGPTCSSSASEVRTVKMRRNGGRE
jgi:hypothetical protein